MFHPPRYTDLQRPAQQQSVHVPPPPPYPCIYPTAATPHETPNAKNKYKNKLTYLVSFLRTYILYSCTAVSRAVATVRSHGTFEKTSMQMTHSRSTSRPIAPHPTLPPVSTPPSLECPCSPGGPLRGEALLLVREEVPVPPHSSRRRGDESDVDDDSPRSWLLLLVLLLLLLLPLVLLLSIAACRLLSLW